MPRTLRYQEYKLKKNQMDWVTFKTKDYVPQTLLFDYGTFSLQFKQKTSKLDYSQWYYLMSHF